MSRKPRPLTINAGKTPAQIKADRKVYQAKYYKENPEKYKKYRPASNPKTIANRHKKTPWVPIEKKTSFITHQLMSERGDRLFRAIDGIIKGKFTLAGG